MRIIARKTLIDFWKIKPDSEEPLKSWYSIAKEAVWKSSNALKAQITDASIITGKRVVFNIKGNDYRLVVDIEYRIGLIFIVWLGTHTEYDGLNIKELSYVKTNKIKKAARRSPGTGLRANAKKPQSRLKRGK